MTKQSLVLLSSDRNNEVEQSIVERKSSHSSIGQTLGFSVRRNKGVVVAIDSTECFVLPSSQVDLRQFKKMDALTIALEEHLPLDAEEMVLKNIRSSKTQETLTIVSERLLLEGEVERLENDEHWIAAVSCMCLLAVQELAFDSTVPVLFDCIWKSPHNGWDLVRVRDSIPVEWQWIDESELINALSGDALANRLSGSSFRIETVPLFVLGATPDLVNDSLKEVREIVRVIPDAKQIDFATLMAARIVKGSATPWVNLAGKRLPTREPWAPIRLPLLTLLGILLTALLTFQFALLWQSSDLATAATASYDEQVSAFRSLYPGQRIPTDIVGLLRSEQRRLQASEEEMQKEPPVYAALPVLSQFLNSLPEDGEFRIDHIRAQSNQIVSAEGATRTLEDFQSLVSSIRRAGFEFQQPNVVNMADGFTVRLEKLTPKLVNTQNVARHFVP